MKSHKNNAPEENNVHVMRPVAFFSDEIRNKDLKITKLEKKLHDSEKRFNFYIGFFFLVLSILTGIYIHPVVSAVLGFGFVFCIMAYINPKFGAEKSEDEILS